MQVRAQRKGEPAIRRTDEKHEAHYGDGDVEVLNCSADIRERWVGRIAEDVFVDDKEQEDQTHSAKVGTVTIQIRY